MEQTLEAHRIVTRTLGRTSRLEAEVDGSMVWFESEDAGLRPSPEAMGCAFLVPALHAGRRLIVDGLCPGWRANVEHLFPVFSAWWDYPSIPPSGRPGTASVPESSATGLAFSGGADSFYTLLRGDRCIEVVVFVHGFDIPLEDEARVRAFDRSLQEISAAGGRRLIRIRTNLRSHPAVAPVNWEIAHGGALAAIGHMLSRSLGTFLISSSHPRCLDSSWGSHWRLDPWWSSSRLRIVHFGESLWRGEKIRAIAGEPLVRRHLRVCWENREPTGNCSRCEKCLRTMLTLSQFGVLRHFPVFDRGAGWADRLDALPPLNADQRLVYRAFLQGGLPAGEERAVRRLLRRSSPRPESWTGLARRVLLGDRR